jgi:hypothetical protein
LDLLSPEYAIPPPQHVFRHELTLGKYS